MVIDEKDFVSFVRVKQGLAKSSVRNCEMRIRVINRWFKDEDLTKENVERFFLELQEKGLNNNTLNTYRFVFRHLEDYFKDRGKRSDFFDGFKSFKKVKPDIVILTQEEIERIINTPLTYGKQYGVDCSFLDFRYRTLTMFLAYTGCRYSEAAELLVKRLDLSAGKATFVNTKTNENRTVYITEPLIGRLRELIRDRKLEDRVFRNTKEQLVQYTDFRLDLIRRAGAADVIKKVNPHIFRHSYATHMLEAGVRETQVASLGGWKDIQTLYSTYMHLADKTLQKAAMRHPLVRMNVDPGETIKAVRESLEGFHLEDDTRFKYQITEGNSELNFSISLRTPA